MLEFIPRLFNLNLKGSESYPLSARIMFGFPIELLVIVGIARDISCLSPEAKTIFRGVPGKSTRVEILVPVFLYLPEYPAVSRKLKLGTSEPSIEAIFRFIFPTLSSFLSIKSNVALRPKFLAQNLSLLQWVIPEANLTSSKSLQRM